MEHQNKDGAQPGTAKRTAPLCLRYCGQRETISLCAPFPQRPEREMDFRPMQQEERGISKQRHPQSLRDRFKQSGHQPVPLAPGGSASRKRVLNQVAFERSIARLHYKRPRRSPDRGVVLDVLDDLPKPKALSTQRDLSPIPAQDRGTPRTACVHSGKLDRGRSWCTRPHQASRLRPRSRLSLVVVAIPTCRH
jgi:hypothetical protein